MVSMDKTYKTRDGCPVRVYCTDAGKDYPVHAAVFRNGKWTIRSYTSDGFWERSEYPDTEDLIEVKPRIKRTYWINIYDDYIRIHKTKEKAEFCGDDSTLARVKIEIDCEEGEGL